MNAPTNGFKRLSLPPHGTYARYLHKRASCRCDKCKEANAAYIRDYRRRTGARDVRQQRIATREALRLFKRWHPDEWRRLLDEAYEAVMSDGAS